jgi:hypothetical protein
MSPTFFYPVGGACTQSPPFETGGAGQATLFQLFIERSSLPPDLIYGSKHFTTEAGITTRDEGKDKFSSGC